MDFKFQIFNVSAKKIPQAEVLYLPTAVLRVEDFEWSATLDRPLKFLFKWIAIKESDAL